MFPLSFGSLTTPYLSFYTPKNWPCKSFGPHWICHHRDKQTTQPIMIIISADLQKKSTIKTVNQLLGNSSLNNAKKLFINKHNWIDSFNRNSFSFQNFSSRYTKTSCCKEFSFAYYVDVGFYAPNNLYFQYLSLFVKSINSFNLSRNAEAIKTALANQSPKDLQEMNDYIHSILYGENEFEGKAAIPSKGYPKWFYLLSLLGILLLAYGGYLYFFRAKKARRKTKSKK